MTYDGLATSALVVHLLFLAYLALGGFLAWRWPRTIAVHVGVVLWGLGSVVVGYDCPLTGVESWARARAGRDVLAEGGFIDHYLTGVIYPERWLVAAQAALGVLVLVSWIGLWRRTSSAPRADPDAGHAG
ncbi:MAG TPA: DUF2784 domain-containing protein [Nocardioides sp.]|uniref:DUF2784 domain-containing protein n=1 Tax=Nocardioides sp. TaxID=35761 RepID=UPI002D802B78|nr:DUF2784 domain-containing protein [Nocardioides sp.]HET6651810.1 DUF2784 domain-containing protein [Nocardioides sp.]